ncbi:hypothetical protein IWQ62_004013 [Dispira parvispora]|uniref:Superoxide dismutase copper/zinc binding domain-containing protein n=1 Tax=Dispira parvispora TaxID=1520584 RepID=A0A9W8E5T0_9FUNG|nr:hypothetical protein IWQ62_004013 [Dispira parvispora]
MKLFTVLSSLALLATTYAFPSIDGSVAIIKSDAVQGFVWFTSVKKCGSSGSSVRYAFHVPATANQTEYTYHIHEFPVGENNNCTATGGHYDPLKVNVQKDTYKCDPAQPTTTCEVGDLSGKHGKLVPKSDKPIAAGEYTDADVHLTGDNSIAGRSVVVHNAAGDRIGCGNIVQVTPQNLGELKL